MNMFGSAYDRAHEKIEELQLEQYVATATEMFGLKASDQQDAERQYRHFLYLVFANRKKRQRLPVVPTKRADMIWHAHLIYNGEYNKFCVDLYGEIITHRPGLTEGNDDFFVAVLHTKELHDQVGRGGFDPHYFSFVDRGSMRDNRSRKHERDNAGDGGPVSGSQKHADGDSDGGSSCTSGCAGSCSG